MDGKCHLSHTAMRSTTRRCSIGRVKKIIKGVAWAIVALVLLVVVGGGIAWMRLHPSPPGLQVWTNGHVLTMDADGRQVTALDTRRDHGVK